MRSRFYILKCIFLQLQLAVFFFFSVCLFSLLFLCGDKSVNLQMHEIVLHSDCLSRRCLPVNETVFSMHVKTSWPKPAVKISSSSGFCLILISTALPVNK